MSKCVCLLANKVLRKIDVVLRGGHFLAIQPNTDKVAIADGRYEIRGAQGGDPRRMWTTFVLTRGDSGWRITAIRNMVPTSPAR